MATNKEFIQRLRVGKCTFYLADFHVHSPASLDVRTGERFERLSDPIKAALSAISANPASDPLEYETQVLKYVPPEVFLQELVHQRDKVIGEVEPEIGSNWAVVSITDHNVCGYSCALSRVAFERRSQDKLFVLPGIELDVVYPCPGVDSDAQIHILCIFAPGTIETDIRMVIRDAGGQTWQPGWPVDVNDLPDFVQRLRQHAEWPAICIAAHVSSGKGVQKETKNTILSHIEAELSRLEGERQSGKDPDIRFIEQQVEALRKQRDPQGVAIEVLKLIGNCGFDALQVASTQDSVHYRRLHRFRDGHGRAAPIVGSDAHRPADVFQSGQYYPHLKLPAIGSSTKAKLLFDDIRRALRYGETRFSATAQTPVQYWISGIQVIKDASNASSFWPCDELPDGALAPPSFTLPLSRNLNTLIGGRGSGKSAAIEAIAFLTSPDAFNKEASKKETDRDEFYTRANATLAGCRIKVCWQFTRDPIANELPKRAMIGQRYFDPRHKHGAVEYTNANDQQLVPQQIPPHQVQIFRLGEIEKQAGAERLRLLFDQICGPDIQIIEREINETIAELSSQRAKTLKIADQIRNLTREGAALRDYATRKRLYEAVNTPELKNAYEEIDRLEEGCSTATKIVEGLTEAIASKDIAALEQKMSLFFENARSSIVGELGLLNPHLSSLADLLALGPDGTPPVIQQRFSSHFVGLMADSENLGQGLAAINNEIGIKLFDAKGALSAKGLPAGSKDREAKRSAFSEAEEALKQYRAAMQDWHAAKAERHNLRAKLLERNEKRSLLRRTTAESITKRLHANLDERIICIVADAQSATDRMKFQTWLSSNFRGNDFKFQDERIRALISSDLTPDNLQRLLMSESNCSESILVVRRSGAAKGDIDEEVARKLCAKCLAVTVLPPEIDEHECEPTFWTELPEEIRSGLVSFPGEQKAWALDQALSLDEIVFDDTPVITLNDRPDDTKSKPRPLEELSPGQRCSAVLPILLLTGEAPLIIDQPEDNLDNRLIRQVIVNTLASIKLRRQVIIATHNPNLPVLGDVESAVVLQGVGDRQCKVVERGDLDSPELAHQLTEVMEGGREAFQYRHTIYAAHWEGPIEGTSPE
jgi:hypothetical protein